MKRPLDSGDSNLIFAQKRIALGVSNAGQEKKRKIYLEGYGS